MEALLPYVSLALSAVAIVLVPTMRLAFRAERLEMEVRLLSLEKSLVDRVCTHNRDEQAHPNLHGYSRLEASFAELAREVREEIRGLRREIAEDRRESAE